MSDKAVAERPKNSNKLKFTPKKIVKAIENTGGIITDVCAKLKCSRPTFYNYMAMFPEIKEALDEEKEKVLDMTEGTLFKLIQNGDSTAIFYYLNNKGKARGYGARPEDEKKKLKPIALSMTLAYIPAEDAGEVPAEASAEEEAGNGGN